ncbi:MAG: hypothetical protein Q9183_006263, partial [Haloplaca sp. 2 TL-2023]
GKSKKRKPAATEPVDKTDPIPQASDTSKTPVEIGEQQVASSEPEETDFETFYLKQVTAEFADDLDRLRNANDFNEKSLPILVDALKGTAGTYSEKDKVKVMGKG